MLFLPVVLGKWDAKCRGALNPWSVSEMVLSWRIHHSEIEFIMNEIEEVFKDVASGLKLVAEISSVTIIGVGIATALYLVARGVSSKHRKLRYIQLRLSFGRFLVVALEFQLAADIIGTAVAPSWDQIAKLGAIALIRTFLSYFLNREIETEEKEEKMIKENSQRN